MAWLLHPRSGRRALLSSRTLVGRAPGSGLQVPDRRVSAEHAVLYWSEGGWYVRDLGSRNGTWLDAQRLDPATPARLTEGAQLMFGGAEGSWVLEQPSPPTLHARREGDERVTHGRGGQLLIPDAEDPLLSVSLDSARGWVAESDVRKWSVRDGQRVLVAGDSWRLSLPSGVAATLTVGGAPVSIEALTLRFRVSMDEEHVHLSAQHPGGALDLGARAHHYLLLTLARRRLEDAALPDSEQGWTYAAALCEGLRMEARTLRVQIYRARQQLEEAGVINANRLIERRPEARQLRLGVAQLEVERS